MPTSSSLSPALMCTYLVQACSAYKALCLYAQLAVTHPLKLISSKVCHLPVTTVIFGLRVSLVPGT